MPELVKVELKNLFRTENRGGGVFLGNDEKSFAIFIGPGELNALILAGGGVTVPRPLTHNLLDMILAGFSIEVQSIVISDLVDDAFHALLTLKQGNHEVVIDCRPSDALVVAVMRKKQVFVTRELFERVEDGNVLLANMREDQKRSQLEDRKGRRGRRKSEERQERQEPAEVEEAEGRKEAPEGPLGDVREVPGIDWSSLK